MVISELNCSKQSRLRRNSSSKLYFTKAMWKIFENEQFKLPSKKLPVPNQRSSSDIVNNKQEEVGALTAHWKWSTP